MGEEAPKSDADSSVEIPTEGGKDESRRSSRWIARWVQLPLFDPDEIRSRIWGEPHPPSRQGDQNSTSQEHQP